MRNAAKMALPAVLLPVFGLLAAGCATVPPPDPITMDEIVAYAKGGPDSPALVNALSERPLDFPLTYANLAELRERGVSEEALDTVISMTVERRARSIAPRYYHPYHYDPWWPHSHFRFGVGIHHPHH